MSRNVYRPTAPSSGEILGAALEAAYEAGKAGDGSFSSDNAVFDLRHALDRGGYDLVPKGVDLPDDDAAELLVNRAAQALRTT